MLTARASILAACAYTNLPDAAQDGPELSDAGAADADLDADLDATVTDASAAPLGSAWGIVLWRETKTAT